MSRCKVVLDEAAKHWPETKQIFEPLPKPHSLTSLVYSKNSAVKISSMMNSEEMSESFTIHHANFQMHKNLIITCTLTFHYNTASQDDRLRIERISEDEYLNYCDGLFLACKRKTISFAIVQ
jgi:hypothetical protein